VKGEMSARIIAKESLGKIGTQLKRQDLQDFVNILNTLSIRLFTIFRCFSCVNLQMKKI
jgi:hypothetical protein